MHFEADDVEPGAREDLDHPARPDIGKLEIVGLDQDERFLHFRLGRIGNDIIKNPAITVGKFGPQFQILFDRFASSEASTPGSKYVTLPASSVT
jgi:hypothetical protein